MADDAGIIEQYARHLEQKASAVIRRFTVALGLLGAALGSFPLFHLSNALVPSHLGLATVLLGSIAGAYLGHGMGERRAVEPRLQARLALHQLQVEQSLIRRLLAAPVAAAPAAPAPAPIAVAPPVVAPAPVAPAPAAPAPAPAPAVLVPQPPVLPAAPPLSNAG